MMALTVTNAEQGETRVYQVPDGAGIIVQNGDHIEQGQELTRGALSPHDVLRASAVATMTSSAARACATIWCRKSRRCTVSRASISTTSTSKSLSAR